MLLISIRAPHSHAPSGMCGEGLMLLADPARPTLSEMWDGRAIVQLVGPTGAEVSIEVALLDRGSAILVRRRFRVVLPIYPNKWQKLAASELRRPQEMHRAYDDAEILMITASNPGLGRVQLQCERAFLPIRWSAGTDRDGPFIRLIDNTSTENIRIERFDFATPAEATAVETTMGSKLRWPGGGLVRAIAGDYSASVISPPQVHNWTDLQRTNIAPNVIAGARTPRTAIRLIELARLWAEPPLPADPFATTERQKVLRAITVRLVSTIGGQRWSNLEDKCTVSDEYPLQEFEAAVGEEGYQRQLADVIGRTAVNWITLEPEKRADAFADALATYARRAGVGRDDAPLAEFLLRLASEPASVSGSMDEIHAALELTFLSPVLIRTARLVVLIIHCSEEHDLGTTYRGWAWA